jgi:ArsR family transcriptional regulator
MRQHLKIFKALSDKNRLRIMKMLGVKAMCVCEITAVLNLAPSTVSKHLSLLHDAELIEDRKEGKWVNYFLPKKARTREATEMLEFLRRSLGDDPEVLADKEKTIAADRMELCGLSVRPSD